MKSTIISQLFFILFLSLNLFSCKNNSSENNCTLTQFAPVLKVDGNKTGTANQVMQFIVNYGGTSGCAQSGTISESSSGNTRTISVSVKYVGCVCAMIAPFFNSIYTFTPTSAGTYFLKFTQDNNNFLVDTIVVN